MPKQVGYEFGELPAGGRPATSVTARYPMATVGAVWSAKRTEWLLSMDGSKSMAAEGGQLGASTFVIQFATVKGSRFHDVNGVTSPETETIGHGRALIFRNGQVFEGLWSRTKADRTHHVHDRRGEGGVRAGDGLGGPDRPGRSGLGALTFAPTMG